MDTKYHAKRTWSELTGRWFDSKRECLRGEELALLEKAGEIKDLQYQVPFQLCLKPSIKIRIDFAYWQDGKRVFEDVKGMGETREFRVKRAWLKQQKGIDIVTSK